MSQNKNEVTEFVINKKAQLSRLEVAKADLLAAKCLFSNKHYPQAVFYLEQSVEKAAKFFGIHFRVIGENELFDIRHDPRKIFIIVVNWLKNTAGVGKLVNLVPIYRHTSLVKGDMESTSIQKLLNDSDCFLKDKRRIINEKELDIILREFSLLNREVSGKEIILEKGKEELFKQIATAEIKSLIEKGLIKDPIISKQLEQLASFSPEQVNELISYELSKGAWQIYLMWLSIIVSSQAYYTRYEYPEFSRYPLDDYNEKNPLVRRFNDLVYFTEQVLNGLDSYTCFYTEKGDDK